MFLVCTCLKGEHAIKQQSLLSKYGSKSTSLLEQHFASVYTHVLLKREIWVWLEVAKYTQIINPIPKTTAE